MAGFVVIPSVGVARGLVAIAFAYGLLAVLAIWQAGGSRLRLAAISALVLLLTGLWTLQPARLKPIRLGRYEKLLEFIEGDGGSLAVTQQPRVLPMSLAT